MQDEQQSARILIVEDDFTSRMLLQFIEKTGIPFLTT